MSTDDAPAPVAPSSDDPFETIALALSGGGFRAAAFSLGTISYLNTVKWKSNRLVQHVKALSTVSGGTITGVAYAKSLVDEKPFSEFFREHYQLLGGERLLRESMDILEDKENRIWNQTHKRHTLINAFAIAYHRKLTTDTFDIFLRKSNSHLEEVIFNATEFSYASAFRFQTNGWFGNQFLNKNNAVLDSVKHDLLLSDIIAASSCFPVGFEPLLFPQDFLPKDNPAVTDLLDDPRYKEGVGIMDGGIVDNQGLASIKLSQNRRSKPHSTLKPFSLVLITDVASPYMDKWTPSPQQLNGWRGETVRNFSWDVLPLLSTRLPFYVPLTAVLSAMLIISCFVNVWAPSTEKVLLIVGSILLTISTLCIVGLPLLKKTIKIKAKTVLADLMKLIPPFYRPLIKRFETIPLGIVQRMLRERSSSAVTLLSDVFLKHVRRLNNNSIYEDSRWLYKRISNFIYELTEYDFKATRGMGLPGGETSYLFLADPELKDPGKNIKDSAYIAAKMETTLWFTKDDGDLGTLDHIIACGHFTTCYNLLMYLTELQHSKRSPYHGWMASRPDLRDLYDRLMIDWKKFKEDPMWMLRTMK
jgi:predicted acylesterase/phospholipase RssA